jgi:hypothetical protein
MIRTSMLTVALTIAALAPSIQAASITQMHSGGLPVTLTGTLPNQGTALEQSFNLDAPGDLTISTSSYATGGFQTNLLLYNSAGEFITAGIPGGTPDPDTGIVGDQRLMAMNLAAGMYTVALTDFLLNQDLTATNLSDGFLFNLGNGTAFVDVLGNTRTGGYSMTIAQGDDAAIPEPSTLWLASPVLGWLALRARRQRRSN